MKNTQLHGAGRSETAGVNLGYELDMLTELMAKAQALASELETRLEAILCPQVKEVDTPRAILGPTGGPASKHVTTVRQQTAQMELFINVLADIIHRIQA